MSDRVAELLADHRPGHALAQGFYTDPELYACEVERVITQNWVLACHESEVAAAGDFRVVRVAGESAIIVRGEDNVLHAHANVCRHRGSLVCLEKRGNTKKFECPYHGWMYGLDGRLTHARSMAEGFDKSAHGLRPVALEVLGGLVFICFSEAPPGLASARRELAEPMAMFGFDNLKLAARKTWRIPANWKLAVENYQECYHCATAHPEYARMHSLMLDPAKRPRVQGGMRERLAACGLKDITIDRIDTLAPPGEQGYGYSRSALFDGYLTGSRDGQPLAPLLGELKDYDGGASDFTVGPFTFLLAYSDHVVAYVFTPVDIGACECTIFWLVRGDAEEGRDYQLDELTWLWDVTTEADKRIIVNNWKGVNSRYYTPGPLSDMERMQGRWIEWLLDALATDTADTDNKKRA